MSRGRGGGGGGFRGGRGGMSTPGGKQRIGGQDMTWDFDPDLIIETKPQEMFPPFNLPAHRPPTTAEKEAVAHFLSFRSRVRAGPLYTVLGGEAKGDAANIRGSQARKAEFNPFDGMPAYTQRYKVGVRKLPKWEGRRYQLRFFPQELWDTIDPSTASHTKATPRGAKPAANRKSAIDRVADDDQPATDPDNPDPGAAPKDDDDDDAEEGEEGRKDGEENLEENFSEDDSDMGGDYNAENYFDDGEQDDEWGDGDALGDEGGFD